MLEGLSLDQLSGWLGLLELRVIVGLVIVDLGLGVASALRSGVFEWSKIAEFYKTNVLPYIFGWLVLSAAIGFIIPPESFDGLGEPINDTAVTVAWVALTTALLASILKNFNRLYKGAE